MTKTTQRYNIFICSIACLLNTPIVKADFLKEGRDAFMNYNFELASENYEKYEKSLKKTPNEAGEDLLEKYYRQLEIAENSLDNVQKIEIIDRIDVPVADYYQHIKLPSSGGRLISPKASVLNQRNNTSDFAFSTEKDDAMMWSELDEEHREILKQSERLMNGSWDKPENAGEILNDGGNARNPFLLSDGLTLYYACDGDGSMGGYDLFVATKDPASGKFRQPMGLGYPFNSPFNEYMMAIDEDNGIGWWVTDRNQIDGKVSIYIFKTNEVRKNYITEEEEDIISLARVDDISITQNSDTDYSAILKGIDQRYKLQKQENTPEFIFPLPGGKIAKHLNDFKTTSAKRDMQQYVQALEEHEILENKLKELRIRYHNTDKRKSSSVALKNQILELETKWDWQTDRLKKMRNTIISAETKQ